MRNPPVYVIELRLDEERYDGRPSPVEVVLGNDVVNPRAAAVSPFQQEFVQAANVDQVGRKDRLPQQRIARRVRSPQRHPSHLVGDVYFGRFL